MFEIFFGLKGFDTAVTITSVVRSAILSISSICTLVRRHDIPRALSKRDKSRLFASHKKVLRVKDCYCYRYCFNDNDACKRGETMFVRHPLSFDR